MKQKRKALTLREKLIKDLEKAFTAAMEAGNFTAAIKAKELISKELDKTPNPPQDIERLSDEQIESLIAYLEEQAS